MDMAFVVRAHFHELTQRERVAKLALRSAAPSACTWVKHPEHGDSLGQMALEIAGAEVWRGWYERDGMRLVWREAGRPLFVDVTPAQP